MKNTNLQNNKAIVRRYVDEVQNGHSIEALESIYSRNFIDHMNSFDGLFQGIEGLKMGYVEMLKAFPDFRVIIHDQIAEGDKVVTYKTVMGTHREEFRGIPATGKKVEYQSIYIFRIENNKISEYWGLQDELKLMQQLGVVAKDNSGKTN
jgi:steroid delta-isomerase-like uncharacterized protein